VRAFGLRLSGRAAPGTSGPAALRHQAEQAAARLPPLLVAADRVAATVAQGVHGRRRVGIGETFWQFRRYQSGDTIQRIDWRQSAKREHVYIRENEWEAAESVWLWQDRSPSMAYRSIAALPEKGERAAILTLALASLLVRGGERVALLGTGLPPSSGRAAMQRLAVTLSQSDPAAASLPAVEPVPRHARVVLIGDFLSPAAEVERVVRGFAGHGVRGHVMQIADPAEETLPFDGRVRFEGMEGEGGMLIGRVESIRADYRQLIDSHRAAIADIARAVGWTAAVHHTDHPPQAALLALYEALNQPPGV
jgi:uncharacterized protein (DUF58 family)